jgi:hypothetical protein
MASGARVLCGARLYERTPTGQLRAQELTLKTGEALESGASAPLRIVDGVELSGGPVLACIADDGVLRVERTERRTNMLTGEETLSVERGELPLDFVAVGGCRAGSLSRASATTRSSGGRTGASGAATRDPGAARGREDRRLAAGGRARDRVRLPDRPSLAGRRRQPRARERVVPGPSERRGHARRGRARARPRALRRRPRRDGARELGAHAPARRRLRGRNGSAVPRHEREAARRDAPRRRARSRARARPRTPRRRTPRRERDRHGPVAPGRTSSRGQPREPLHAGVVRGLRRAEPHLADDRRQRGVRAKYGLVPLVSARSRRRSIPCSSACPWRCSPRSTRASS